MISILAGDIIGSVYEFDNQREFDINKLFQDESDFTDDSVLTIATAHNILSTGALTSTINNYAYLYHNYATQYKNRGYGGNFMQAISQKELLPYNSWGNGSAMRVGPIGFVYSDMGTTLVEAYKSAACTHNHPEGIKGAMAIAGAMLLARTTKDKNKMLEFVSMIGYDIKRYEDYVPGVFDVSCQGTIPIVMSIFMGSNSLNECIEKGIKLGGDVDTNLAIIGGLCDAYYGLPDIIIVEEVFKRINLAMSNILTLFINLYIDKDFKKPDVIGSLFNKF